LWLALCGTVASVIDFPRKEPRYCWFLNRKKIVMSFFLLDLAVKTLESCRDFLSGPPRCQVTHSHPVCKSLSGSTSVVIQKVKQSESKIMKSIVNH
jgi:hypothetical protein